MGPPVVGGSPAFGAEVGVGGQLGEQLVHRDPVQAGEALQAQDGNDPLAPLVGT